MRRLLRERPSPHGRRPLRRLPPAGDRGPRRPAPPCVGGPRRQAAERRALWHGLAAGCHAGRACSLCGPPPGARVVAGGAAGGVEPALPDPPATLIPPPPAPPPVPQPLEAGSLRALERNSARCRRWASSMAGPNEMSPEKGLSRPRFKRDSPCAGTEFGCGLDPGSPDLILRIARLTSVFEPGAKSGALKTEHVNWKIACPSRTYNPEWSIVDTRRQHLACLPPREIYRHLATITYLMDMCQSRWCRPQGELAKMFSTSNPQLPDIDSTLTRHVLDLELTMVVVSRSH